jgi:PAS domain-containing protein
MRPADESAPGRVSPDERLARQELAALVPCVARSLHGAVVLWRINQGAGQVLTSELLVVTPQVLAFAHQAARLGMGALLVAPAPLALCATPLVDLDGVCHGALCVLFSSGTADTRAPAVQEAARVLALTLQRQRAHAQLQSMLDGLHEGVILLDHRLQVQASNRRAGQLLGQAGQGLSQHDFTAFGLQARGLDGQPIPRDGYAHVVIDTPPGELAITRSAMLAADTVLIPIPPSLMDLDRLRPTLEVLADLEGLHEPQVLCLLTRVRRGTRSSRAAREVLVELGLNVLQAEISLREGYANGFGLSLSDALGEYADVLTELQGQVPQP